MCLIDALPSFVALAVLAVLDTPARYAPRDLALVLACYYLLALVLTWQAVLAARVLPWLAWIAALPGALALAWQVRVCLRVPRGKLAFAMLTVALCLLLSWLARRRRDRIVPSQGFLAGLAAGAALLALLLPAFDRWNDFRWHVLRHNSLLGMPLYYARLTPTAQVIEQLRSARGRIEAPPEAPPFGGALAAARPPDIVFVMVDTLRADRLDAYGGTPDLMPNANALAARATVFADVHANATWTRPSIGSMFTGLLQEHHGAVDRNNSLKPDVTTMAEHLSARGFHTVAFVTNFAAVGAAFGFDQGFAEFFELEAGHGSYLPAADVNRRVEQWLQSRPPGDAPLFLYVHYLDPHEPWVTRPTESLRSSAKLAAYDADVRSFDGALPELLDSVREHLGREAVVVFTSDHGEEFGEHGTFGHGSGLSPEQIRIPLLVELPGVAAGRLSPRLEGRDLFSLVGYLAGGGRDLAQWAERSNRAGRYASIFLTTPMSVLVPQLRVIGMRAYEQDAQLLRWSAYGRTWEFYDLTTDPDQRDNSFEARRSRAAALEPLLEGPTTSAIEPTLIHEMDPRIERALRGLGYVD